MISVILLIFTIVLLVIGLIFGFIRGAVKQGVRMALWIVLFGISLLAVLKISDAMLLFVAQKINSDATGMEQLVELYLGKVALLKNETSLIEPLTGLVRSFIVPVVTIALFWVSGLISFIIYLIVPIFLKKVIKEQTLPLKAAGAVLGVVMALFAGAVTVYPVATVADAVKEGDYNLALQEEFDKEALLATAYEGTAVSKIYQFSGTEALGKAVHNTAVSMTVDSDANIWTELPAIVRLGNEGWTMYEAFTNESDASVSMQEGIPQVLEAFFALNFISDENRLHLLKNMKNTLESSMGDSLASDFLGLLEVQNKEQLVNDMSVLGKVYDILKKEGVTEELLAGNRMPHMKEETVNALVDSLYELSNSDVVMPEVLNLLYASVLNNADIPFELPDIEWTEETKAEISEVVSIVNEISEISENKENLSEEEKEEIRNTLEKLEDNSVISKEFLEELVNSYDKQ